MSGGGCCLSGSGASGSSAMVMSSSSSSSSTICCPVPLLILFIMVTLTESVPTLKLELLDNGQQEMGPASRSFFWSTSAPSHMGKRDVQPIQLCGYRLLEAVRGLCRGNYVGYSRRSDPEMQESATATSVMLLPDSEQEPGEGEGNYRISRSIADMQADTRSFNSVFMMGKGKQLKGSQRAIHFRRNRRNIIDECCKKSCSVAEMLRYCGRN